MALLLGTFLDVEGAFNNVAFKSIERALNQIWTRSFKFEDIGKYEWPYQKVWCS